MSFATAAAVVETSAFRAACLRARTVDCEREKPPSNAAIEARPALLARHADAGPLHEQRLFRHVSGAMQSAGCGHSEVPRLPAIEEV